MALQWPHLRGERGAADNAWRVSRDTLATGERWDDAAVAAAIGAKE